MKRFILADVRVRYAPNDYSSLNTAILTVDGFDSFDLVCSPNWNDRGDSWFDCTPSYAGRTYDTFEVPMLRARPLRNMVMVLMRHARDEANHFARVGSYV